MPSVSFLRHAAWFGPEDAQPLNIIGVGATGSWIGLVAAKMGFHKFRIWDADIVEDHNLPNQIYDLEHVGKSKVDSFESVLTRFNPGIEVEKHNYFFTQEHKHLLDGPLILTVDTMSARKEIYETFKLNWKVQKVFETRIGFDYGELNIIDNLNTTHLEEWRSTLVDDKDIPDGPCNLRICTTLVTKIAGFTVHNVCSMLSSSRRNTDWNPARKTMFDLKDTALQTYHI